MELTVMAVSFTVLLLIGVPVAFAIGLSSVATILAAKGRVICTGIGKSGHVARKIAATMASTASAFKTAAYYEVDTDEDEAEDDAPAAEPAPGAAEKPAATVAKTGTAGSSWYSSQPTGNVVVQILGTSSEANAQAFVKEQGDQYRYFKKVLNGKPLYVITYGNFSSRAAADSAIKSLPAKVQAGKPWPRTVASVQQELAATR